MRLIMTPDEVRQHQNGRAQEENDGYGDQSDYLTIKKEGDGSLFTYLTFRHYDIKVPITVSDMGKV